MPSLRIPSRALPRAAALRFPIVKAPSRFSSTTTSAPTSPEPSAAPIPPASSSPAPPASKEPKSTLPSSSAKPSKPQQAVNYFVSRTASQQLPVYESKIRGGSVTQTKVRKVEGNIRALKLFLQAELGVEDEKIRINPRNNHIDIRGKYKIQVDKLLESRGF